MSLIDLGRTTDGSRDNGQTTEYWCYFAVIFLFSLPWAVVQFALDLGRSRDGGPSGILGRALHQARIITPFIFRS